MKFVTREKPEKKVRVWLEEKPEGVLIHVGNWNLGMLKNNGELKLFTFNEAQAEVTGLKLDNTEYGYVQIKKGA